MKELRIIPAGNIWAVEHLRNGRPDTDEAVVPVTCWLCEEVIPEDSPGNVVVDMSGLFRLICDDCFNCSVVVVHEEEL